MNENIIVYEDLKIKSIKDIVIPKPFEVLVSVEDHFYNLCQENFGETTKFFEQFIREGPGETHYDNFQYLFQFFNNNPLVEPKSDNLYFQLLQTLVEIFKPTLRTQYNTDYKIACKADLNSLFQEEKDGFDSSDSEESGFSDELTQIIRNDDVSKFQQFFITNQNIISLFSSKYLKSHQLTLSNTYFLTKIQIASSKRNNFLIPN